MLAIQEYSVGFDLRSMWEQFVASLTARNVIFFVLLVAGIVFAIWTNRQKLQKR